jgi:hypothetical protein
MDKENTKEKKVKVKKGESRLTPKTTLIVDLLKHPLVRQSHIADKIFLGISNTNKSKLTRRLCGDYLFTDEEVEKTLLALDDFCAQVQSVKDQINKMKEQ